MNNNAEQIVVSTTAVENAAIGKTSTGKVKFFNMERGFGFLRADDNLKELFFHICDVKDQSQPPIEGDKVTFLATTGEGGRPRAADVRLVLRRIEWVNLNDDRPTVRGYVRRYGKERQFGFIDWRVDGEMKTAMFSWRAIIPDVRGHRCDCMETGTQVEFVLNVDEIDRTKLFATNVRAVNRRDDADPNETEISEVILWSRHFGFLRRECGEEPLLLFHDDNILTLGVDGLNEGGRRFVRHKVRRAAPQPEHHARESYDLKYKRMFEAFDCEIFQPGFDPANEVTIKPGSAEEFFLNSAPEPEPVEPAAAPEGEHVYTKAERKMTIRELIALKQ